MFSTVRWRLLLAHFLLILLLFFVYGVYLSNTSCLQSTVCLYPSIFILILLTAVSTSLTLWHNRKNNKRIQQLTQVMQRIAQGDTNARILPHGQGTKETINDLIYSFNLMQEKMGGDLTLLQEENKQFRTLLATMGDGVIIVDEVGYVRLLNVAAAAFLNVKMDVYGRSFAEVVRHHQLIDIWTKARTTNSEQQQAVEMGNALFLHVTITPYQEETAVGYLILIQDLTQLRHLQTVRRDFVSNISHELRTPLASLKAVVETLQDGALDDPPAAQHFLSRAANEIDTLTQMVAELLELARIESGQVPLRLQETAVSDLLLMPLDRLQAQAKRKKITLALDVVANLPPVIADKERIQRVVTNLVYNAIKFTDEGGAINLSAQINPATPDELIISVKDNGVGIASEDLPRIFERFFKSDRARTGDNSGTGLGLAISRHIVQAHNGRIWVKSKEGKGSTFTFTLPYANTP